MKICETCPRRIQRKCAGQVTGDKTKEMPRSAFTICDGCKVHGRYPWCTPTGC